LKVQFTRAKRIKILSAIEKGMSLEAAAASAGVSRTAIYLWVKKGKRGEPGYIEFVEDYEAAKATYQETLIDHINSNLDNKTALWMLERKDRAFQLSKKIQVEISKAQRSWVEHLYINLDAATFDRVMDALSTYDESLEEINVLTGEDIPMMRAVAQD
jgi:transposase